MGEALKGIRPKLLPRRRVPKELEPQFGEANSNQGLEFAKRSNIDRYPHQFSGWAEAEN